MGSDKVLKGSWKALGYDTPTIQRPLTRRTRLEMSVGRHQIRIAQFAKGLEGPVRAPEEQRIAYREWLERWKRQCELRSTKA